MKTIKRVLCLHGYGMNAVSFRRKLSKIESQLNNKPDNNIEYEFLVPNGFEKLSQEDVVRMFTQMFGNNPSIPTHGEHYRWYNAIVVDEETGVKKYIGLKDTQARFVEYNKELGPVGIIGFSQGACMGIMLNALMEMNTETLNIKCLVSLCGFLPNDPEFRSNFSNKMKTPSLIINYNEDPVYKNADETFSELKNKFDESTCQVSIPKDKTDLRSCLYILYTHQ